MSGTWYDPILIDEDEESSPLPDNRLRRSSAPRGGATVTNRFDLSLQVYGDSSWSFYFDIELTRRDIPSRLRTYCYVAALLIAAFCLGNY